MANLDKIAPYCNFRINYGGVNADNTGIHTFAIN